MEEERERERKGGSWVRGERTGGRSGKGYERCVERMTGGWKRRNREDGRERREGRKGNNWVEEKEGKGIHEQGTEGGRGGIQE